MTIPDSPPFPVLTCISTHSALRSQQVLSQAGVPYKVIPTPREISRGCGIALRFEPIHTASALHALAAEWPDWERDCTLHAACCPDL